MADRRSGRLVRAGVLVGCLIAASCSGDDAETTSPLTDPESPPVLGEAPHDAEQPAPEAGDIDVDAPVGTFVVPVPSLGFGLAVPENWQATLLSAAALERLEGAQTGQVAFVDAAVAAADAGAVFYAAGIDGDGRVSELKLRVDDGSASIDDLRASADDLAAGAPSDDVAIDDYDHPVGDAVVLRFSFDTETADGEPVTTVISQLFLADETGGGRVWNLLITTEDVATLQLLEAVFFDSFVAADPT